jgi:hypothetical protein
MILDAKTPAQAIDIWQPRWKDRVALVAKYKVGEHNVLTFSRTKSLEGEFYISGADVRKYPIDNNGKLDCYAVPLDALTKLERK